MTRFNGKVQVRKRSRELAQVEGVNLRRDPSDGRYHVLALSGGKDSCALAILVRQLWPERVFNFVCTPTGNELPEMLEHWARLEEVLGQPITQIQNGTLVDWIGHWKALPSWRMRWCTRELKLVPMALLAELYEDLVMYVGLRADETNRGGLFADDIEQVHPFQLPDVQWGLPEVLGCLREHGIAIPARTDCAWCFFQTLEEWFALWKTQPELWALGERLEDETGHTFRSPGRDTWPPSMRGLRKAFEGGRIPRRAPVHLLGQEALPFGQKYRETFQGGSCRVCSL
jgi:hypothetical protein